MRRWVVTQECLGLSGWCATDVPARSHFDLLDPAKDSFAFVERRHQGGDVPVQDTISPRKEMAERLAVGTSPVELENTTRARAVILIDRKSGP